MSEDPHERPGRIELVLHPERGRSDARPLRVDLRPVLLVGIAAFVVAGVVCSVLVALDDAAPRHVGICVAGVLLGLVGLGWERSHRSSYRGED